MQQGQNRKTEEYLRDNISAMAVKLGEMQAQLIRLDALSEHITQLSGAKVPSTVASSDKGREAKRPAGKDGQGGPLIAVSAPLAAGDLQREIDRLAERIRERLQRDVDPGQPVSTVSIGVATLLPGESLAMLLRRSDRAMYAAKRAGRNRVALAKANRVYAQA